MVDPVTTVSPATTGRLGWLARAGRTARRLGPAGPFAMVAVFLPLLGGMVLLGTLRDVSPWCRANATGAAPFILALAGAFLAGASLLPTYAITILAGWSLGFWIGLPAAFVAHAVGGIFGFGLARTFVGDSVVRGMRDDPRFDAVRRAMVGRGFVRAAMIVALIRLAPVAPFGITNLLAASSRCPLGAFAVGSSLGILPQTALLVWAASRMSGLSFEQEPWMGVLGIVATLIVVTLLGAIARRALNRVTADAS